MCVHEASRCKLSGGVGARRGGGGGFVTERVAGTGPIYLSAGSILKDAHVRNGAPVTLVRRKSRCQTIWVHAVR